MSEANSRRIPKQKRSRERYDAILATAANLFHKNGFDTITTNEIALKAGMSIGSLYQYFDDKAAIVEGLADQYVEGLRGVTDKFLAIDVETLPTSKAIDRLLDPLIAFYEANPALSPLWLGTDLSRTLETSMQSMDDEVLDRVESLVNARVPGIRKDRAHMVGVVIQGTVKSLLALLGRQDSRRFKLAAVREFKRMLVEYVEALTVEHANNG